MSPNPETSSQGQHTVTTSGQGQAGTTKAHTTVTVEEALPDSLIDRVKDNDLQECLRELRKDPTQINAPIARVGQTQAYRALELAARLDELEALEGLLKVGADPNVASDEFSRYTALLCVARDEGGDNNHRKGKAIQALLEAGADALHQDFSKDTALHLVAAWKDVDPSIHKKTIELLLAKESDILVNMKNNRSRTPLAIAIASNQAEEIISLFEKYAAYGQSREQSSLAQILPGSLIGSVKDSGLRQCLRELRKDPTQINNKNHAHRTPLLQAICNNELEVLRALLKAGADPNAENNQAALHCAIEEGNLEAVGALIAARADVNRPDNLRYTPLHTAVQLAVSISWRGGQQAEKIVKLLAQQPDIDFNKENCMELTPLGLANKHNNQRIAGILKQNGAIQ